MQIRIYAALRDLVGQATLNISTAGMATAGDVLEALAEEHPGLKTKLWDANGNLTGVVTVLLNGRSIQYLQGLNTPVCDSDTISLFPPVGGGSSPV